MARQLEYLCIIGFSRAGTTSMFNYLSDHPEVAVANRKELNFFNSDLVYNDSLNKTNDLKSEYSALFGEKNGVKLDATPAYIDSLESISALESTLKLTNYKVIIILRDRFERLNSWFSYARMKGLIEASDSLKDILEKKTDNVSEAAMELFNKQNYLNNYSKVLKKLGDIIPLDNIIIIRNEDLYKNPQQVLLKVAQKTFLSEDFFIGYNYKRYNRSSREFSRIYKKWIIAKRSLRNVFSPWYFRWFARKVKLMVNPRIKKGMDKNHYNLKLALHYNKAFEKDENELKRLFDHLILK